MLKCLNVFVLRYLDDKENIERYTGLFIHSLFKHLSITSFKHCKCIGFVYEIHNKFAESTNISYLCRPF